MPGVSGRFFRVLGVFTALKISLGKYGEIIAQEYKNVHGYYYYPNIGLAKKY